MKDRLGEKDEGSLRPVSPDHSATTIDRNTQVAPSTPPKAFFCSSLVRPQASRASRPHDAPVAPHGALRMNKAGEPPPPLRPSTNRWRRRLEQPTQLRA